MHSSLRLPRFTILSQRARLVLKGSTLVLDLSSVPSALSLNGLEGRNAEGINPRSHLVGITRTALFEQELALLGRIVRLLKPSPKLVVVDGPPGALVGSGRTWTSDVDLAPRL